MQTAKKRVNSPWLPRSVIWQGTPYSAMASSVCSTALHTPGYGRQYSTPGCEAAPATELTADSHRRRCSDSSGRSLLIAAWSKFSSFLFVVLCWLSHSWLRAPVPRPAPVHCSALCPPSLGWPRIHCFVLPPRVSCRAFSLTSTCPAVLFHTDEARVVVSISVTWNNYHRYWH